MADEMNMASELIKKHLEELKSQKKFDEGMMENNVCSRGVSNHYWHLYSCGFEGRIVGNKAETKSIAWYSQEQIKKLSLEPIWAYWFRKRNII